MRENPGSYQEDRNREHDNVSFKTWIINLFEDERGETSIKPVIAFLGALFLCGTMFINSINPSFVPVDFLVDAVMIITSIGLGADSIDKFSFKGKGGRRRYGDSHNDGNYGGYDGGYGGDFGGENNYSNPINNKDGNIGPSSNDLL